MTTDPPYLFADVSAWQPAPDFSRLTAPWVGAIVKCTEGLHYAPDWFLRQWRALASTSLLRGCYHFLRFGLDGRQQADYCLAHVERAGGWRDGDIRLVVDVERASANVAASAQQVIDCVSAFAARAHEMTGRPPILYGRGCMRDLEIRDRMGCDGVWCPSYTARMQLRGLEAWTLDDVLLWQISDGVRGDASVHHLPLSSPIGGDVSIYVQGAEVPTWGRLVERMCVVACEAVD